MAQASTADSFAYCTLITRSSYLAGVIVLAHTLVKNGSRFPLIVLYTDTLPESSIRALELEASKTNLIPHKVTNLLPRKDILVNLIAERFADTWTKLRVFQLHETYPQYTTICYLDADMIVCKNMDAVFSDVKLPDSDWISANHACVCNLDKDPWAPSDWTKENCAYTAVSHPTALTHPTPVTPSSRPTYHLLNSGMFVFRPSPQLWQSMLDFFNTTPLLAEFKFPDQDFLATFFSNRWVSAGWQYNALKTMRYWHPNIWRDDEVVCLHYIVDKPWAKRVGEDGKAGYLGRDGVTHTWWWEVYDEWRSQREKNNESEILSIVERHVDGSKLEENDDMRAIGAKVQAFANNTSNGDTTKQGEDEAGDDEAAATDPAQQNNPEDDRHRDSGDGSASNHPRGRMNRPGERGHGPRVRGGSSQMPP